MLEMNKSGHMRRTPTDNRVIESGGLLIYRGKQLNYDKEKSVWMLNNVAVGSISDLSKGLGMNVETHDIGFILENHGYVFNKPFQ